jgi:hypothetical protein
LGPIDLVVRRGPLKVERVGRNAAVPKPSLNCFAGCGGKGKREYGPRRVANRLRAVGIAFEATEYDRIHAHRVGGAEYGPHVTGLFEAVEHENPRLGGQNKVV